MDDFELRDSDKTRRGIFESDSMEQSYKLLERQTYSIEGDSWCEKDYRVEDTP